MKLTRHNGRAGKNGAYNPKHNDRQFDVANSDHIDQERAKQNVYWDCYQGYRFPTDQAQEDQITYSFEQIEQAFYSERYDDFCEAQHERNRLAEIAAEFFEEFDRRFGKHIHILDWALHLDEATPHIHERHVFDCENRYGEIAPQQEKALEALGFERPHPDQKASKLNSRKITFDAACRVMLFDICERHGLHLDREPEYGGRAYLEKQDYILMKQKEKMAVQDQQIESKEAELEAITIRIEDTEAFVEEVADAAYEQAVDVVTKTVQEEIRNEDFDLIEEHRRIILNNTELSDRERNFAHRIFAGLMNRFKGMTRHISERMAAIFRSPEKKAEIKEPIKESIRDRLARNQKRADELNARRRAERGVPPKRKQQNIEL